MAEFDCFAKSFFYLASKLPRRLLLDPFIDSATREPLANIESMVAMMQTMKVGEMTGVAVDVAHMVQGLAMAVGRPLPSSDTSTQPLAVAEPDTFPCIMASCGSGVCFTKAR